MTTPRALHCLYAWTLGYFWLPCPVCGRYFGGHENGGGHLHLTPSLGKMTCPDCPGEWHYVDDDRYAVRDDGRAAF